MKTEPKQALAAPTGDALTHWRSLEHREGSPALLEEMAVEFPGGTEPPSDVSRREIFKMGGAAVALGSLVGCVRRPEEEILPFTRAPESVIPGVRLMYATTMARSEGAVGILVESHEGRPTKIEGNPNHPSSQGAADVWAQAEILRLYDPDRARAPLSGGKASSWGEWDNFAQKLAAEAKQNQGRGLAFLVGEEVGPTFDRLLGAALSSLPEAKVYRWDPLAPDQALRGSELAFGPGACVQYQLEKATVLLALDADFLNQGPDHLRLARQYGLSRTAPNRDSAMEMNRLYVAEGSFSTTGANADHRLRVASAQIMDLLRALIAELNVQHPEFELGALSAAGKATLPQAAKKFVTTLAKDLAGSAGSCAILVGEHQPAPVHALAYALNTALGAQRSGVLAVTKDPAAAPRSQGFESLSALTGSLGKGEVKTLVIFEANPLYAAPGGLKFSEALAKAATVIHAGLLPDETAQKATWHVPLAHFLESWSDARAWDGTASLVQPLILPLHGGRSALSLFAQLSSYPETLDRKLVEETWRAPGMPLFEARAWRRALHDGVINGTTRALQKAEPEVSAITSAAAALSSEAPSKDSLEVVRLWGSLQDGRLSNVSWLQELPDSMTKLCWDNALLVSPALAKELGIESRVHKNNYVSDEVELTVAGRSLRAPTFVLPGLAGYTLAIASGYGKTTGGVASGVGVNSSVLFQDGLGVAQGVKLVRTGATRHLCSTQDHFAVPSNPLKELTFAHMSAAQGKDRRLGLGERGLVREGTLKEYATEGPGFAKKGNLPGDLITAGGSPTAPVKAMQLTQEISYEGQQWGMVIDLSSCIGCNACVVACVAENNIPTVGREEVLTGRELHWMRLDRYFSGDVDDPKAAHQPVNCMHCENAPCEPVCPVSATVHDEEGLNSMAYNRCIGTRYCANNCPYKVRRYNYLDFSKSGDVYVNPHDAERQKTLKLQRNPDVTVRYRGVMEKCTYCTQRIEEAKISAKRDGKDRKDLPDGAVVPACAQTCPTRAITFGNINQPTSSVAKLKQSDRNYEMLQELNIRPRTTYLARLRNENEELA